MYRALVGFTDLKDGKHKYAAGDVYPREGYTPDDVRINELLSGKNKRNIPVIGQETTADKKPRKRKKD